MNATPHSGDRVPWSVRDCAFVWTFALVVTIGTAVCFSNSLRHNPYVAVFLYDVAVLVGVGTILRRHSATWDLLGFTREQRSRGLIRGGVLGLAIYLTVHVVVSPSAIRIPILFDSTGEHFIKSVILLTTVRGFTSVLVSPIAEEMLYRGMIYQALRDRWGRTLSMIIVTLLHSVMHLSSTTSVRSFLVRVIFIFSITVIYDRYKSLYPAIACHGIMNYLSWFEAIISNGQGEMNGME